MGENYPKLIRRTTKGMTNKIANEEIHLLPKL